MPSPSDQAAMRADQSAFACVPRHLVEEFSYLLATNPGDDASISDAFEFTSQVNAAAREIADAALDDIS